MQVDEIWAFIYAKAANVPTAKAAPMEAGDVWTWVALDADNKLAISWLVGKRDAEYAHAFISDTYERLATASSLRRTASMSISMRSMTCLAST